MRAPGSRDVAEPVSRPVAQYVTIKARVAPLLSCKADEHLDAPRYLPGLRGKHVRALLRERRRHVIGALRMPANGR
jgi:hypothetical protein